jgi:hypothetical protein
MPLPFTAAPLLITLVLMMADGIQWRAVSLHDDFQALISRNADSRVLGYPPCQLAPQLLLQLVLRRRLVLGRLRERGRGNQFPSFLPAASEKPSLTHNSSPNILPTHLCHSPFFHETTLNLYIPSITSALGSFPASVSWES